MARRISIFDLSESFNNIMELALDESMDLNELESALQSVEGDVKEKCQNGIGLIHSLNDRVEAYKKQEERFALNRKRLENKIKSIKQYYMEGLKAMGKDKVPTDYGVMAIRKNGGKQSVRVDEVEKLPEEYTITETVVKANTDKLREDLQAGKTIVGAVLLERGYHLAV